MYKTTLYFQFRHHLATLKRTTILRARKSKRRTPTSDITNLLLCTRRRIAALRHHTAFRLKEIIPLHQAMIAQHTIRDAVPKRGIQWRARGPGAIDIIRGPGVILELPDRRMPVQRVGHIRKVRLDPRHREGLGVDLIELVAGVVAGEGCDGRADQADLQWLAIVDESRVPQAGAVLAGHGRVGEVVVEDLELVFVRVPEKDAGDGGGREAADDGVEEGGRVGERVGAVIAGEDVADDPGPLACGFGGGKLVGEEFEDPRGVWVGEVPVVEDVVGVPEVGVDGDDTEALGCGVSIGTVVSLGVIGFG